MANQNNTTAWADLPNANYIDIILGLLKKENTAWDAAKGAAWDAARYAASDAAYYAARDAIYDAADDAARDAAFNAAWDAADNSAKVAAYDAVRALIAWDDCGALLDENPEDVKIMGLLGNQAAVLLYPACFVLNKSKELENNVSFD